MPNFILRGRDSGLNPDASLKIPRSFFREFLLFTIHEKENLQKTIDKFPITEYNENTKELPLTVAPYGYVEITALLEAEAVISFYRNDL